MSSIILKDGVVSSPEIRHVVMMARKKKHMRRKWPEQYLTCVHGLTVATVVIATVSATVSAAAVVITVTSARAIVVHT